MPGFVACEGMVVSLCLERRRQLGIEQPLMFTLLVLVLSVVLAMSGLATVGNVPGILLKNRSLKCKFSVYWALAVRLASAASERIAACEKSAWSQNSRMTFGSPGGISWDASIFQAG